MNLEKTLKNFGRCVLGTVLAASLFLSCDNGTTSNKKEDNDEPAPQGSIPTIPTLSITPEYYEPNRWMKLTVQDNSDNEEGFKIERRKYGESEFTSITTLKNGTTFEDKQITKSTNYEYRVNAFNSSGTSDWSYKTATSVGTQTGSKVVYAIADTFVVDSSTTNYGSEACVEMGAQPNNGKDTRSLLKFSLPTIPSYSIGYKGANLHLNDASGKHNSYNVPIEIYANANTNSWNENSVTYGTRPGIWVTNYGYTIKGADDSSNHVYDVDIDISNMVSAWYDGEFSNHGLTLRMPNTNNFWNFYSRELYPELGCASIRVDYDW